MRQVVERREQQLLRRRVERRGRLVEDDDRGVAQDRPGDRDPLALAAGEVVPAARRGGCRGRRAGGWRTRRRARGAPARTTSRSLIPARPQTRLSRSVPSSSTVSWATIAIWLRRWCSWWSRTSTPSTSTARRRRRAAGGRGRRSCSCRRPSGRRARRSRPARSRARGRRAPARGRRRTTRWQLDRAADVDPPGVRAVDDVDRGVQHLGDPLGRGGTLADVWASFDSDLIGL